MNVFCLTFYGKSPSCRIPDWLYSPFLDHLGSHREKLKAHYNLEPIVKGDYVVGFQLNLKEPIKVDGNLDDGPVRVQYLGQNLRLFMSRGYRNYFRAESVFNPNYTVVNCESEDAFLKFYFPEEKRLPTLESIFK